MGSSGIKGTHMISSHRHQSDEPRTSSKSSGNQKCPSSKFPERRSQGERKLLTKNMDDPLPIRVLPGVAGPPEKQ